MKKPIVLAVVDYYLPGYKGGGPIVSLSRMIRALKHEVDFCVFTRDRDLGDTTSYVGVKPGDWNLVDGTPVFYATPELMSKRGLLKAIEDVHPDVIYLNSYFSKSTRIALWLRRMGKLKGIKVVLAPRGEFSEGALKLKSFKKATYMRVADVLGFHNDVLWHVSTEHEKNDALAVIDNDPRVYVMAPDLLDVSELESEPIEKPSKAPGYAEFCWISRISPKKNLIGAIESLMDVKGGASLTVYGPIEDEVHWNECLTVVAKLPSNVKFHYAGGIPASEVRASLGQHHFFLFPTLGENFGHVIPEALAAGCPVLVSDTTPWLDLNESGVGFVLPLESERAWKDAVQSCVDEDSDSYDVATKMCVQYLRNRSCGKDVEENSSLFERALAS